MPSNNLIKGKVMGLNGKPIANAVVMIRNGPGSHPDIAILTNDKGAFDIYDLESGSYTLLIRKDDYLPKTVSMQTNDLSDSQLIVELEKGME